MLGTSNSYVASTLRKDSKVSFVIYIRNTPVGCSNVNFHRINKAKGRLDFPLKTKSPSGATAGGIPPPKKWSPFFVKIRCKRAKYASTQTLGESTRDANRQRAKKRESGIAHASSRIRPFPLAALPTTYSCEQNFPAKVHLRKWEGGTTQLLK
jgi:hypothetical protein